MQNFLSFDVEDYHQLVYRDQLGRQIPPTRHVVERTAQILSILQEFNARATFFVVGQVAECYPELVRQIARAGHEVATHGHTHRRILHMTRDEFSTELAQSLALLRELSGHPVVGHRAPIFSINADCEWAFDVMLEHGIVYDSSLFPIIRGHDELLRAVRLPHYIRPGLIEVPLSVLRIGRVKVPFSGGSYFRLWPYRFMHWALGRLNREGQPVVVYLHPYEFDTALEPFDLSNVSLSRRLRVHLLNLEYGINRAGTARKLRELLNEFQFTSVIDGLTSRGMIGER